MYTLDYQGVLNRLCQSCKESFETVLDVLRADDLFNPYESGKISSFQYYTEVTKRLSLSMNFEEFKETWNSILVKQEDMFDLALELEKNVKVAFLSNTNEMNAEAIKNDMRDLSQNYIFSNEVGFTKPDYRIFQIALDRFDLTPTQCIFVDDQPENVEAARSLGISAHLYENQIGLIDFLQKYGIARNLIGK
jgi:putative hydrolase of the HAD superfamily